MSLDFNALGSQAVESEDLTKAPESAERKPHEEGTVLLRLRDYIELGRHKARNPAHKPALNCILVFESLHPKHMLEHDGKKFPQTITVRVNKGATKKSGYYKLFNQMNEATGNKCQHFIQMVGMPFIAKVYHNEYQGKIYANLDKDGVYSFREPVQEDALTGESKPVPVPELHGDAKAFLWENASVTDEQIKEMWDSIFIEGTRTDKDNKEVSKNWIQETIMSNLEWEGSRTQSLVQESISIDELAEEETPADGEVDLADLNL